MTFTDEENDKIGTGIRTNPLTASVGMKIIVGFSGGADSQATALLARQQFPAEDVILLNCDPGGNEHPLTTAFIAEYSTTVFPVITVHPIVADLRGVGTKASATGKRRRMFDDAQPLTFDRLAFIKGRFPSRMSQFCTTFLKLEPQRRWCRENLVAKGLTFERWAGVRRDESRKRADTPDFDWDELNDCIIRFPVAKWSKREVFAFLAANGEEVNPLYRLGFSRVGCAPCINCGKDDIREWAARFPEMIDKVRGWEAKTGRTFFAPCVPGMRINFVDDVVTWSRTSRGGRQQLLRFVESEADLGTCASKYGLCE